MHARSPRRLALGCSALALALLCACTDGEDASASSLSGGSFTAGQPTQGTSATQPQTSATDVSATDVSTTGEPPTTGQPVTVTEASGSTTDDPSAGPTTDPSTTTGPDPSTTDPDPSTTTGVDPSTSTTDPDPSTTTGMTSMTTMEDTTGEPMMPPAKDPQPQSGLYEHCLDNTPCDPGYGCFMISDAMTMEVFDGYCTGLCNNVADCGPAPKAPATQECFAISPDQKVCGLKCKIVADCPTGMVCTNLTLPNNQTGLYCT